MMEVDNYYFNEIRPYNNDEVKDAVADLLSDKHLEPFFKNLLPDFDFKKFTDQLQQVNSIYDFQSMFAYTALKFIIKNFITTFSNSGLDALDDKNSFLFISNHRDIVLDSSLMNFILFEKGHNTSQTAIGDNLYVSPIITHFLKLNKSFTVKRNIQPRAFYDYSKNLSAYINYVIKEKPESVWIAQREGRAKDGNDKTQYGLLKMLMMSFDKAEKEIFFDMNVVPVAVSYEFDPCDYLKAIELYMSSHEMLYEKTPDKDLKSMMQGIMGFKGNVHIAFGKQLTFEDFKGNEDLRFNDWVKVIADKIDNQIHTNYHLWVSNYVAYDLLYQSNKFADKYSETEKAVFIEYLSKRIAKVPEIMDSDEIRNILLSMYANPVKNYLEAC